ncbi:MAG: transposase [Dehalococcoidia bacterium]|nr:transposase [Dehalococcoidia bacterium]
MLFDPERHHRRSVRLRNYDYRQAGAYFVTIVAKDRECLFGEVVEESIFLSVADRMVAAIWDGLPAHYPQVELDAFVVMPNHIHGIVVITNTDVNTVPNVGAGLKPALAPNARPALPGIVRALKTFSARRINAARNAPGTAVWQRGYHERISRDEPELDRIRRYIEGNPAQWETDEENPQRLMV